jgi:hypothetical protein
MGVSLAITWPDGNTEFVDIGGSRTIREGWTVLGRDLGLEWIANFDKPLTIERADIPAVREELKRFREAAASKPHWEPLIAKAGELLKTLDRLEACSGWNATIG